MLRSVGARPLIRRLTMSWFAVLASAGSVFLLAVSPALAQSAPPQTAQNVQNVANAAGLGGTTDLVTIIGRIIYILLGFIGIILVGLLLYAGYLWMTAAGDASKVEKAKNTIRNAIIGLVIIVSAFALTNFILNALIGATGGSGGSGGPGGGNSGGFESSSGSLGAGIIESHLPTRNATDVPRNTPIIVTFKKPMKLSSIIRDYNDNGTPDNLADDTATIGLNDTAVKIYQTSNGVNTALTTDKVRVSFTKDRRTFVFRPIALLGSSSVNTGYTVELRGGRDGILLENGDLAFGGAFSNGYIWQFEVGTIVDNTPPKITSVIPVAGNQYARNIIVQINFNEAVDPTAASGFVNNGQGFQNIQVHGGGVATAPLDGEYKISNQYKTVEFVPSVSCGKNSCGRDLFCLPGGTSIDAIVKAASLDGAGPAAQFTQSGYDGVTDVVGNSMDGNADGKAQGPGADDYSWAFGTSNDVNRDPPVIEATMPTADPTDPGQSNIDPFAPVTARFNSLLQSSTVNTDNAYIQSQEGAAAADTFWWTTGVDTLTSANQPVVGPQDVPAKAVAVINHRQFAKTTEYDPFLLSGIQNQYQNCFNPASGPACPVGAGGPNCCQGTRQNPDCKFP
jgi:hypothetical protein